MTESAMFVLADGSQISITRDEVLRAAVVTRQANDDEVSVRIQGRDLGLVDLMCTISGRPADAITLRGAFRALQRLGIVQGDEPPSTTSWAEPQSQTDGALFRRLQRMRGRWVAISDGDVVSSAESLSELLAGSPDSGRVSVMRVPKLNAAKGIRAQN
jgi:hypothetical protein